MQIEITHLKNHSQYWTNIQVLRENNLAYQNQTLSSRNLHALLLSLKERKTQDDN